MKKLLATLTFSAVAMAPSWPHNACLTPDGRTLYVNATMAASGNGTSRGKAFRTIQEVGNVARAGDTVEIAAGDYRESVTINATGTMSRKTRWHDTLSSPPYW